MARSATRPYCEVWLKGCPPTCSERMPGKDGVQTRGMADGTDKGKHSTETGVQCIAYDLQMGPSGLLKGATIGGNKCTALPSTTRFVPIWCGHAAHAFSMHTRPVPTKC